MENCENCIAICLASVMYKMYMGILEKILRDQIENQLEGEKAAFRKGKNTKSHQCRV